MEMHKHDDAGTKIGVLHCAAEPLNPLSEGAMRFLFDLGQKDKGFFLTEINGDTYANTDKLHRVLRYEPPDPACINIQTLCGLVDWLHADVEKVFAQWGAVFVVVDGVDCVRVMTPIHGERGNRAVLAMCLNEMPRIDFDTYMPQEDFIVMLQTHFCEGENRDKVAAVAGNIRMQAEADTADDGMSQRVTLKAGAATMSETVIRNPVFLAPRRTFPEIIQPASPFVLRIKNDKETGPNIALFEADGGAWKLMAIRTIGDWLKAQLDGLSVVVIA